MCFVFVRTEAAIGYRYTLPSRLLFKLWSTVDSLNDTNHPHHNNGDIQLVQRHGTYLASVVSVLGREHPLMHHV